MADNEKLKSLVDQMPDADKRGMYTTDIDKEQIETAIAEIHKGGAKNVTALVAMLGAPGSEENVKPHYALHCLANHVLVAKDERGRKALCEALGRELAGDHSTDNKAYLCQELGWAGRDESLEPLGKALSAEGLSAPAAMALVAIGGSGAAKQLRAAWPKAGDAARRDILDALAELADSDSAAIFDEALGDEDPEIRIAAAAGMAKLGDADSVDPLLRSANSATGWEQIQATAQCLTLAENLAAAGKNDDARRIYKFLKEKRNDEGSRHIQEAADRGMAALA